MKYIIVNDETELYHQMFYDAFHTDQFDVEEIPKLVLGTFLRKVFRLHHARKINEKFPLPFKEIWSFCYGLTKYHFEPEKEYCVLVLNGALRTCFSEKYFRRFRLLHPNVKLVLLMYDHLGRIYYKNKVKTCIPLFDRIFSFDIGDCKKYGFHRIYQTFSKPDFVCEDQRYKTDIFFAGMAENRLSIIHDLDKLLSEFCRPMLIAVGVDEREQIKDSGILYNSSISYHDELMYAYNTSVILEIVSPGQSGGTLRMCEAIYFRKKLLTNNSNIRNMPFYDERYIRIFGEEEIEPEFVLSEEEVDYGDAKWFSPLHILEQLEDFSLIKE